VYTTGHYGKAGLGELFQMRVLMTVFLMRGFLFGADYCSLAVNVIDPSGREVNTRISVREQDGNVTEHENVQGGAKFCNLGITPVTVTVGSPSCNQTIVRNVPVSWGTERRVTVLYDRSPCMIDEPPVAACQFLLRFVDAAGEPMIGVRFEMQKPEKQSLKGDRFGRVLVRIPASQEMHGVATHRAFLPAEVTLPCVAQNQILERYVRLYPGTP
jgi:hypothetical protein